MEHRRTSNEVTICCDIQTSYAIEVKWLFTAYTKEKAMSNARCHVLKGVTNMAACKHCDGIGTVECPECPDNDYNIFHGIECDRCAGELFILCPECGGTGHKEEEK